MFRVIDKILFARSTAASYLLVLTFQVLPAWSHRDCTMFVIFKYKRVPLNKWVIYSQSMFYSQEMKNLNNKISVSNWARLELACERDRVSLATHRVSQLCTWSRSYKWDSPRRVIRNRTKLCFALASTWFYPFFLSRPNDEPSTRERGRSFPLRAYASRFCHLRVALYIFLWNKSTYS